MIKKSLLPLSLTALACSLLSGCVSYRNAEGLPTWLEHGSRANQIAYFMGLKLEDSRAPKGYDPTKNTLVTNLLKREEEEYIEAPLIETRGFTMTNR